MQSLLLLNIEYQEFDVQAIHHIFQSVNEFRDIRFNEPGGNAVEADYLEGDDSTIVGLSGGRRNIALSGTTDAALRAAIILQQHLDVPLRIIDLDYSFDLLLRDYPTVEELRAAMDKAQAD
jgi:hypothetical protein